jgi:hypothetical protein
VVLEDLERVVCLGEPFEPARDGEAHLVLETGARSLRLFERRLVGLVERGGAAGGAAAGSAQADHRLELALLPDRVVGAHQPEVGQALRRASATAARARTRARPRSSGRAPSARTSSASRGSSAGASASSAAGGFGSGSSRAVQQHVQLLLGDASIRAQRHVAVQQLGSPSLGLEWDPCRAPLPAS